MLGLPEGLLQFPVAEGRRKNTKQNSRCNVNGKKNNDLRCDIDKGLVPLEGMIQKINEIHIFCLIFFFAPVILLVPVAVYFP